MNSKKNLSGNINTSLNNINQITQPNKITINEDNEKNIKKISLEKALSNSK